MPRSFVLPVVIFLFSPLLCASEIVLTTGEVLEATVLEVAAESIEVDHPLLGRLTIAREGIVSVDGSPIQPPPAAAERKPGADVAVTDEETEASQTEERPASPAGLPASPPPPAGAKKKSPWDSQIELGLTSTDGSTQDTSLRLGLRTSRKTERSLLRGDASHRLTTSRGDRTENRFTAGLFGEANRRDSRWSAFGQGRLDVDEFQAWDRRITLGGGAGYRILDFKGQDDEGQRYDLLTLTGRVGGGFRKEYGSPTEEVVPEGLLGLELAYRISKNQRLSAVSTMYPDLAESGEIRLVSTLDWSIDIEQMDGISLKIGLVHEYESQTDIGVPHNDVAAQALLVVDF